MVLLYAHNTYTDGKLVKDLTRLNRNPTRLLHLTSNPDVRVSLLWVCFTCFGTSRLTFHLRLRRFNRKMLYTSSHGTVAAKTLVRLDTVCVCFHTGVWSLTGCQVCMICASFLNTCTPRPISAPTFARYSPDFKEKTLKRSLLC